MTDRSINLNIFFRIEKRMPPPSIFHASSTWSSRRLNIFCICRMSLYKIYPFIRPSRIKNAALTELPMIPPMVLKLSNRDEMAAAVAATTMEVMMTILMVFQYPEWQTVFVGKY